MKLPQMPFKIYAKKTHPTAPTFGCFDVELRGPWLEASTDRSAEVEAMLAQKEVTSQIHERAYRNRPLTEEQKESNR